MCDAVRYDCRTLGGMILVGSMLLIFYWFVLFYGNRNFLEQLKIFIVIARDVFGTNDTQHLKIFQSKQNIQHTNQLLIPSRTLCQIKPSDIKEKQLIFEDEKNPVEEF